MQILHGAKAETFQAPCINITNSGEVPVNLRAADCQLGGSRFSRNKKTYAIKGLKAGPQLNKPWPILLQPADRAHAYLYAKDVQDLKGKEICDIYVTTGNGKRYALSKTEWQRFVEALANAVEADPG